MQVRGGQHAGSKTFGGRLTLTLLSLTILGGLTVASAQDGDLQRMQGDVRGVPSSDPAPPSAEEPDRRRSRASENDSTWGDDEGWGAPLLVAAAIGLASPIWGPHAMLGNRFEVPGRFPRFPYDHTPGYLVLDESHLAEAAEDDPNWQWLNPWASKTRCWAGRFDVEYAEDFDSLNQFTGHLLVSTLPRLDLDAQASYFEESLSGARHDHLWLGDANLTFRFAQNEYAQFRTGIGVNWLTGASDSDFGFNFTYGVDVFPYKPLVLTSVIDWGTLGHAELFRFRATAGVVVHGVEVYTGYEYFDLDRTQTNSLVGGVRIWF
jgi:hypothetical protein